MDKQNAVKVGMSMGEDKETGGRRVTQTKVLVVEEGGSKLYGPGTTVLLERPDAGAEYVLVGEGRKRELTTTRKGRAKGRKGAGRIQPAELVDFLLPQIRPRHHHS